MAGKRHKGLWFGTSCDAEASPPLAMIRAEHGDMWDVFYYRAEGWCKRFERTGCLAKWWPALASSLRWPGSPESMAESFRKCHLVSGPADELYDWHRLNGWLNDRQEAAAKHMEDKRKAGKASGRARRAKAKQMRLALVPKPRKARQATLPKTRGGPYRKEQKSNGKETPERLARIGRGAP